ASRRSLHPLSALANRCQLPLHLPDALFRLPSPPLRRLGPPLGRLSPTLGRLSPTLGRLRPLLLAGRPLGRFTVGAFGRRWLESKGEVGRGGLFRGRLRCQPVAAVALCDRPLDGPAESIGNPLGQFVLPLFPRLGPG